MRGDRGLLIIFIKAFEEIIIAAPVYLFKLDQNTYLDVELAGLVFCVGASSDITASALKLLAKLFLRNISFISQCSQIIANTPITSKLLFHIITSHFLTNIGCN